MEHGRMEITVLQSALQVLQVCASFVVQRAFCLASPFHRAGTAQE
jgi:hypothetical protein